MTEKHPERGILIIGTGTLARWAAQLLESAGSLVYGFSPTREHPEKEQDLLSILSPITEARMWKLIRDHQVDYVVALTDPVARERMAKALFERTQRVAIPVLHDSVFLAPTAELGGGSILLPCVVVGISAHVGGYVLIESHTYLGAGTTVEDFVNIGSGCQIGENCVIESYSYIGRGAVLLEGVRIGKGAQVLPGTLVRESVKPGQVYGG